MIDENWKKKVNTFLRTYVGTEEKNISRKIAEEFVRVRFVENELKRFLGNVTVSILTIVIEYAGVLRRKYQDMSLCDCDNLLNFIRNIAEYPNDEAWKRFSDLYEIVSKENEGNPDEREALKECYRSVSAASMAAFFDFKFYLAHAGMALVPDKRIAYSREEQVNLIEQGWIHGGLMYVVNKGTGIVKDCGHDFVFADDMGDWKHVLIWQPAADRETGNINFQLFVQSGPFFQMAPITIVENANLNVVQKYVDALSADENVVCVPYLDEFTPRITNLFKVNYVICDEKHEEEPHITPVINREIY